MAGPGMTFKEKMGARLESMCFLLLALQVFWAPIPLASMNRFAIGVLLILSAVTFLSMHLALYLRGERVAFSDVVNPPLLCLYGYIVLLFVQSQHVYSDAASIWLPVSADVYSTKIQWLFSLALAFNFITISVLGARWKRLRHLLWVVVLVGVFQAFLGLYLYGIEANYQFLYMQLDHASRLKGTFGYHNSFAGLMEICLAVTLGLMLTYFSAKPEAAGRSLQHKVAGYLAVVLSEKFVLRLFVVLMFVALVLTKSRMGNTAFMTAMIVTLMLSAVLMRDLSRKILILLVSILLIDAFLLGQTVGIDKVIDRIEQTSVHKAEKLSQETVEERLLPSSQGLEIVAQRPVFGFGAGAFYATFGHFYHPDVYGYFENAHNDYIEVLVETGYVGFALLAGLSLSLLWASVRLMRQTSMRARGLGVAGLMMSVEMWMHASVDFNYHITSNVLMIMFVYACVWIFYKKHVE